MVVTLEGITGIDWTEAKDAAKHPARHRALTTSKNFLVQNNAIGVEVEKHWFRMINFLE